MESNCFAFEHALLGYSEAIVQRDFSWRVNRGEGWIVSGTNGSGKTTLIRTLLGLLPLKGGELLFFDEEGRLSSRPSMAYLPQINQIDRAFPITVREVIRSGLIGTSLRGKEERERVDYMIEAVGVTKYANSTIGGLSGGELQRVLLARALAPGAAILVLDEPDSFLDPEGRRQLGSLIHKLTLPSCTIVMITHQSEDNPGGWIQICSGDHPPCGRAWKRLRVEHRWDQP